VELELCTVGHHTLGAQHAPEFGYRSVDGSGHQMDGLGHALLLRDCSMSFTTRV